ncbi:unnamed protein product [Caenorhabditis auriculariae]|uniref:N-acetylgalactosaminide beta-1,3-galactosyltransferase n=1 Tax=Caenorhabditis auriculariae TaxID=2777116 RepID=A0A8S1HH81_9PELO|nr:unnamed protein product [Caenorhabditis auriculariae]
MSNGFRVLLGCLVFVTLFVLAVVLTLLTSSPSTSYDRKNDHSLLPLIVKSPALKKLHTSGDLFCWVQTSKQYHDTRALAISETWIRRCTHGQLFTSEPFEDDNIPYSTVFAGIPDEYSNLFYKSRYAFHYIYQHISKDFRWYLKADDDTYVIVEHLTNYLLTLDHDKPYFLGYVLKPYLDRGYNAGGAGYVLSRAALKIFSEQLYPNETLCPDNIYEDVGIANCLANVGIFPGDTRNSKGQNRFNAFSPADVFHQKSGEADWRYYPEKSGYDAFARDFISFHKLAPDEIRLFDILLYRTE